MEVKEETLRDFEKELVSHYARQTLENWCLPNDKRQESMPCPKELRVKFKKAVPRKQRRDLFNKLSDKAREAVLAYLDKELFESGAWCVPNTAVLQTLDRINKNPDLVTKI